MQAKKDNVKENCKRLNTRIEKVLAAQAPWAMPNDDLRQALMGMIQQSVLSKYRDFWQSFEQLSLLKTPQKYFKCAPPAMLRSLRSCAAMSRLRCRCVSICNLLAVTHVCLHLCRPVCTGTLMVPGLPAKWLCPLTRNTV